MTETRKAYKDSVFRKLFGDSSNRNALLSLYNALNQTNYEDPSELIINTIDDAIYMGIKNDISCIIDSHMVLIEHQSSYNPNMPLRGLMYFSKLYDQFIKTNSKNLYSSKLIQIPTPRFYVFYNGPKKTQDKTILRLSDAFIHPDSGGNFEWVAEMININRGYNQQLMQSCQLLWEYVQFVDRVRFYLKNEYEIDEAIRNAVDDCIRGNILKPFLVKNKSEVIDMCICEYDEAETLQLFKEESYEEGRMDGRVEGRKEGRVEGREEMVFGLVNDELISSEIAAERLNISVEHFLKKLQAYNDNGKE